MVWGERESKIVYLRRGELSFGNEMGISWNFRNWGRRQCRIVYQAKEKVIYILKQVGGKKEEANQKGGGCLWMSGEGQSSSMFGIVEDQGLSKWRQKDLEKDHPGVLRKKASLGSRIENWVVLPEMADRVVWWLWTMGQVAMLMEWRSWTR